jgi:hypothetical protein
MAGISVVYRVLNGLKYQQRSATKVQEEALNSLKGNC